MIDPISIVLGAIRNDEQRVNQNNQTSSTHSSFFSLFCSAIAIKVERERQVCQDHLFQNRNVVPALVSFGKMSNHSVIFSYLFLFIPYLNPKDLWRAERVNREFRKHILPLWETLSKKKTPSTWESPLFSPSPKWNLIFSHIFHEIAYHWTTANEENKTQMACALWKEHRSQLELIPNLKCYAWASFRNYLKNYKDSKLKKLSERNFKKLEKTLMSSSSTQPCDYILQALVYVNQRTVVYPSNPKSFFILDKKIRRHVMILPTDSLVISTYLNLAMSKWDLKAICYMMHFSNEIFSKEDSLNRIIGAGIKCNDPEFQHLLGQVLINFFNHHSYSHSELHELERRSRCFREFSWYYYYSSIKEIPSFISFQKAIEARRTQLIPEEEKKD